MVYYVNRYLYKTHEHEICINYSQNQRLHCLEKIFDEASSMRKEAGEISYQVLQYEGDSKKIVHFSVWHSLESAKNFFQSHELIKIRINAGVKSPEFIYLEQLESGIL